jgi:hypothetical protein
LTHACSAARNSRDCASIRAGSRWIPPPGFGSGKLGTPLARIQCAFLSPSARNFDRTAWVVLLEDQQAATATAHVTVTRPIERARHQLTARWWIRARSSAARRHFRESQLAFCPANREVRWSLSAKVCGHTHSSISSVSVRWSAYRVGTCTCARPGGATRTGAPSRSSRWRRTSATRRPACRGRGSSTGSAADPAAGALRRARRRTCCLPRGRSRVGATGRR